jgi:hypothetical protein
MTIDSLYAMNPDLQIQIHYVGQEKEKVIIIDNLMTNPNLMVDYALENAQFHYYQKQGNHYPGIRLPPPRQYFESLYNTLRPILNEEYEIAVDAERKAECSMSLLTLKPEELSTMQSLPHFDSSNSRQFALLHYLCADHHGGTAFYRHRQTGYETVTKERFQHYTACFMEDIKLNGRPQPGYIVDTNERFEKIDTVNARFNRMVIYRSYLLHSACIDPAVSVNPDPRTGRLTANAFVVFK